MEHRGRFQVHGYDSTLLDSETWNQAEPLRAADAHRSLDSLYSRVQASHRTDCAILEKAGAFAKTHGLIDRLAQNNGHGPYKWSWPIPSRKDKRRVDTEINHGRAFI